jgi:hypothetical protein
MSGFMEYNKLERKYKKAAVAFYEVLTRCFNKGAEKTLRKIWSRIDLKPVPPEYVSRLPTTVLRHSVFTKIGQNEVLLSILQQF